jgi:hypothetical protein
MNFHEGAFGLRFKIQNDQGLAADAGLIWQDRT